MCGIAGLLGRPSHDDLECMMRAMASRGPDDCGVYADEHLALGHRRLSVIDLSRSGHQPMSRAAGKLWIAYNGEVYNYQELRRDLEARGHRFVSRTDTEVILALYEEMGAECVTRLRGMFAFAVWDRRTSEPTLFLARDHFGIKPLLYANVKDGIVFASDLPGLLASGRVSTTMDRVALVQYLMHGHVVQPRSILSGVKMLPAAHALIIRPGSPGRLWRYWELDYERCSEQAARVGPEDRPGRVRQLLTAAARREMVSDVPLGAFLSGGVDSCALVSIMMNVSGEPVHTYSIGFAGAGGDLDESDDARRSAEALGARHVHVPVTGHDVARELPRIAAALGQPTIDGVNMYFVSAAARRGVTVALAGIGGDEIFAGYPWFAALRRTWESPSHRHALGSILGRTGLWKLLPRSTLREAWEYRSLSRSLVSDYMLSHTIRPPSEALRLAGSHDIAREELFEYEGADDPRVQDVVNRVSRLDVKLYMCSQLLRDADAASMAHSLEVRVPFLDLELVEFAYGLPGGAKLAAARPAAAAATKVVLVQACRDLIPEWTYRKPKRGFILPFSEWLRGPLRALAEDALGDSSFRAAGLLAEAEIDGTRERVRRGREKHWSRVWSLIMLVLWWHSLRDSSSAAQQGVHRHHSGGQARRAVATTGGG